MNIINKIIHKIKKEISFTSQKAFTSYLKNAGVKIGENFNVRGTIRTVSIDISRPSLITIGDNVTINSNFSLMTHDFVSGVFLHLYNDFIPSSGPVKIGNNVRFGINCTVLKNVTIGDNCFIAAGAVVTKDIPANSIAGGVPAKVICSIEDYYVKRQKLSLNEAFVYARSIANRFGRQPNPSDFWEEFPFFVDKHNINDYPEIPIRHQLMNEQIYDEWLKIHKAIFSNFEDFITAALNSK